MAGPLVHQLAHPIAQRREAKLPTASPGRMGGGRAPLLPRSSLRVSKWDHGTHPMTLEHRALPPDQLTIRRPGAMRECRTCCGVQAGNGHRATSQTTPVSEPDTNGSLNPRRVGNLSAAIVCQP